MKWIAKPKKRERIKTWFALFPVTIGKESRWMETVKVKQKLLPSMGIALGTGVPFPTERWFNVAFIDKKEK